jgi:hypothetical protein
MTEQILSNVFKPCPFCAEFIQSAATVCRYCGRQIAALAQAQVDDMLLIQQAIATHTEQGWEVVSQSATSVQLRKPRQWSTVGIILFVLIPALGGCVWFPLFGVALLGVMLVAADYLMKKDDLTYLTADQIREERRRVTG